MRKFISAGQDGTVRFDQTVTDSSYAGLHTTNLQSCWGVIVCNQTTGRFSLTHKTFKTDPASIATEVRWVGAPDAELIIIMNQGLTSGEQFKFSLKQLNAVISVKPSFMSIDSHKHHLLFNKDTFEVSCLDSAMMADFEIEEAPASKQRHQINVGNNVFIAQDAWYSADLQFNGKQWTAMPVFIHDARALSEERCVLLRDRLGDPEAAQYIARLVALKGDEYTAQEDHVSAGLCYKNSLHIFPQSAPVLYAFSFAVFRQDRLQATLKILEACLQINPMHVRAIQLKTAIQEYLNQKKPANTKQQTTRASSNTQSLFAQVMRAGKPCGIQLDEDTVKLTLEVASSKPF